MWMDDSNRGGGEPPHGHGPVINVLNTSFVDVKLSLPGFQGLPDRHTNATFTVGFCRHGAMVVDVRGCAVLPLPCHASTWRRIVIATRYLFGRITAPNPDAPEACNDGA
jgi:hypothetical protein